MTAAEIYAVARQAGFPPDTATKMTAIALKESGGNPAAYNGTGPDNSYGLWQINMIGTLGPARRAQFGLSDNSQLLDPLTNAKAAYAIWNGNDANLNTAWAINRGVDQTRYLANLPTAEAAASSIDGSSVPAGEYSPGIFSEASGSDEIDSIISSIGLDFEETQGSTTLNTALMIAGGTLFALLIFSRR